MTIDRSFRTVSTVELTAALVDPATIVVDARPLAAYNGWRLEGEARGGHIPGAIALPASWLPLVDDATFADLLATKGVPTDAAVVVYGYGPEDARSVSIRLHDLGQRSVVYDGWAEWSADDSLPLERLPRHDKLVHPGWLSRLLAGERPEAYDNDRFALFHVNFGVPEEYADGHLPGAHYLDTNWLESSDDWNRRTPGELTATLASLGVTANTTVVLYGRDTVGNPNERWPGRRAGQIAATRAAAILRYSGVADVRLLDGGYDRWVKEGYPLEVDERRPVPVPAFGVEVPQRPDLIVDIDGAKAILADQDGAALVSVRTWREHIGQVSGYNYIEPKGRIAGDVWGNCGSDAYHMQHYRNVDNTMRPYPEIASNWAAAGITGDKWVAFYCGTGWRASETWFYAYLMGWERIAVYDGGWFEWSRDPVNNPIEIGDPVDEAAA